jgi:flotillin
MSLHPFVRRMGNRFSTIQKKQPEDSNSKWYSIARKGATFVLAVGFLGFCASRYKVALPNQRIVRTGIGIRGMHISQKCIHWPFQKLQFIELVPWSIKVKIEAMSNKRIEFHMPTVWTLAPDVRSRDEVNAQRRTRKEALEREALKTKELKTEAPVQNPIEPLAITLTKLAQTQSPLELYATRLMTMSDKERVQFFEQYIQGEARVIAGNMDLNDIAGNRLIVQQQLREKLEEDFAEVGVTVLNANIADIHDKEGQDYFAQIRKKALSEAESAAKVATAEADQLGNVGKAKADGLSKKEVAMHNREALVAENLEKEAEWQSKAKLAKTQSEAERDMAIAIAMKNAESQKKESQLQKEVEEAKLEQQVAHERAKTLSTVKVQAEIAIEKAKGEAAAQIELAKAQKEAEVLRGEGILAILKSQSEGLDKMRTAAGGNMESLNAYLFMERKGPEAVTSTFADAVAGMKPHITVWNRTEQDSSPANSVTDFLGMMPHFLKTMERQSGYKILPQLFPAKTDGDAK